MPKETYSLLPVPANVVCIPRYPPDEAANSVSLRRESEDFLMRREGAGKGGREEIIYCQQRRRRT